MVRKTLVRRKLNKKTRKQRRTARRNKKIKGGNPPLGKVLPRFKINITEEVEEAEADEIPPAVKAEEEGKK